MEIVLVLGFADAIFWRRQTTAGNMSAFTGYLQGRQSLGFGLYQSIYLSISITQLMD